MTQTIVNIPLSIIKDEYAQYLFQFDQDSKKQPGILTKEELIQAIQTVIEEPATSPQRIAVMKTAALMGIHTDNNTQGLLREELDSFQLKNIPWDKETYSNLVKESNQTNKADALKLKQTAQETSKQLSPLEQAYFNQLSKIFRVKSTDSISSQELQFLSLLWNTNTSEEFPQEIPANMFTNESTATLLIGLSPFHFSQLPKSLQSNKDLQKIYLRSTRGYPLQYENPIGEKVYKDPELLKIAITEHAKHNEDLSSFWNTEIFEFPKELPNRKQLILDLCKEIPETYYYAGNLRNDLEFTLDAINTNSGTISFIDTSLFTDTSAQQKLFKLSPFAYYYLVSNTPDWITSDHDRLLAYAPYKTDIMADIDEDILSNTKFTRKLLLAGADIAYAPYFVQTNEKHVKLAVSLSATNFVSLPRKMRENEELALLAISGVYDDYYTDHDEIAQIWNSIDPSLTSKLDFQTKAIMANSEFIQFVDENILRDNGDLALSIVSKRGAAYKYLPQHLLENEKIIKAALKSGDWDIANYIPEHCWTNELADMAITYNPFTIYYMPQELQLDKQRIKNAASTGIAIDFLPPDLSSDKDFILELMAVDINAVVGANFDLINNDHDFIAKAAKIFPPYIDMFTDNPHYKDTLFALHPELRKPYESLKKELQDANIDIPQRLKNMKTLRTVLDNRTKKQSDNRPTAVVVFAKDDWNGAFMVNSIEKLTAAYNLQYFEADDDHDMVAAIKNSGKEKAAELVIIGGHGTRNRTSFGSEDPAHWDDQANEHYFLDFSDHEQIIESGVNKSISPHAQIYLKSCSTGKGRGDVENMVNFVASLFPGRTVHGPTIPANNFIHFDAQHLAIDPGFLGGKEIGYSTSHCA